MRIPLSIIVVAVCAMPLCAFAGEAKPGARVMPSSGKELCSALVPADFTKVGVPVTALRNANLNPGDVSSAYCIYASKSGNVEFDIFFPAGDTPQEVRATEKTVLSDGSDGKSEPVHVSGADSAEINLAIPGKSLSAGITVRRKNVVFAIYIPANSNARQQLASLAQTVLGKLRL